MIYIPIPLVWTRTQFKFNFRSTGPLQFCLTLTTYSMLIFVFKFYFNGSFSIQKTLYNSLNQYTYVHCRVSDPPFYITWSTCQWVLVPVFKLNETLNTRCIETVGWTDFLWLWHGWLVINIYDSKFQKIVLRIYIQLTSIYQIIYSFAFSCQLKFELYHF